MIDRTVAHYRIVEQLGSGGMGVVYKAEDLRLGRAVALKFLPPELSRDSSAAQRFEREARTASALNHPNICTIYGIDEFEGQRFIAMELLDGHTLSSAIAGRPLPIDRVLELGIQIADALDAAHAQGILHRDIKPANIFITKRGQAKVLDFGLAKLAASPVGFNDTSDDSPTIAGMLLSTQGVALGTVAYMSPEQARGEILDARSDLFSFGIVLYEMATGHQAFPGQTSAVVFDSILNRMPAPIVTFRAEIPPQLDHIIMKALEKDRALRYQTASDLHADLKRLKRDRESGRTAASGAIPVPSGAVPLPSGSQPVAAAAPRRSRWPLAAGALVLLLIAGAVIVPLALGGGSYPWSQWVDGRQPPSEAVTDGAAPAAADPDPMPVEDPDPELTLGAPGANADASATPPVPPVAEAGATAPAATAQDARNTEALTPGTPAARSGMKPAPRKTPTPPPAPQPAPVVETPIVPLLPAASPIKADPGATLLGVAQAKADARLYDQAIADIEELVRDHPASSSAPAALMTLAGIRMQQARPEDAMAVYVEVRSRYRGSPSAAEAGVRYADLLLKTRRPDRIRVARETLAAVARDYADSLWAPRALTAKADLEAREKLKESDPTLGATVPAALLTWHTLAERYPDAREAQPALWNLASGYEEIRRYDYAAQTFVALATRFPQTNYDAWWRAAELYDKRLKDRDAAKNAYAKVPQKSRNYQEAQRRAK